MAAVEKPAQRSGWEGWLAFCLADPERRGCPRRVSVSAALSCAPRGARLAVGYRGRCLGAGT